MEDDMGSKENASFAKKRAVDHCSNTRITTMSSKARSQAWPLRTINQNGRTSLNTSSTRPSYATPKNGIREQKQLANSSSNKRRLLDDGAAISRSETSRLPPRPQRRLIDSEIPPSSPRTPISSRDGQQNQQRILESNRSRNPPIKKSRRNSTEAEEIPDDIAPRDYGGYKHQWSFISAVMSSNMFSAKSGGKENSTAGTAERISKGSAKYLTHYLHPRGIRINQDMQQDELEKFQDYLDRPTDDLLRSNLANFYLDDDEARIECLIQFAQDYKGADQNEAQWTTDVCVPYIFGASQRPPSKLKDGMIERRAQEFIFSQSKETKAVRPPPVLQDAKHSVPVAEYPPDKTPGQGGYFLDWMFATRDGSLRQKIRLEPAIRTNAERRLLPTYAIAEVKQTPESLEAAMNYCAWVSGSLLHERLRFRGRYEDEQIEFKEEDAIYAIIPAGTQVNICKMHIRSPKAHQIPATEKEDGDHVRCEFKLLDSFDLTFKDECKALFTWMNLIHYYGMTKHRDGVKLDINKYKAHTGIKRPIIQLGNATFRYRRECGTCSIRDSGKVPTLPSSSSNSESSSRRSRSTAPANLHSMERFSILVDSLSKSQEKDMSPTRPPSQPARNPKAKSGPVVGSLGTLHIRP